MSKKKERRRRALSMELKKKERKKSSTNPQEQEGAASDAGELTLVKAAAWAWYQHGSGCSGSNDFKPVDDSLTRTRIRRRDDPRPSRHRLEALSPPGSLLLDLYEIEQITKDLNHLIVSCRRDTTAAPGSTWSSGVPTKERSNNRRPAPAAERKVSGLARIGLCRPGAADVIEASVVAGGRRRIRRGGEGKEGANGNVMPHTLDFMMTDLDVP